MSVKHIGLVLDHFDAKPALKLVAIVLADHADSDGICWPSYRRIAERANMDERRVRRLIKELIDLGIVTKLRTGSLVKQNDQVTRVTNAYRVNAHILINRKKLSPTGVLVTSDFAPLQVDKKAQSRGAYRPTKPSLNRQTNHQYKKPVDNTMRLDDILDEMLGE